ncbi:hypothetical protein [Streptomyces alanosinicus]|uniref:Secreted protein n=1 Tax=Streptomyces alanosinicus TaxID=68171 RepID=A0A918INH5_9ACTN|nr:hypothetical protein [Streptomyces alanosinicus]GGW24243.1 hypothetical protein GCM10010339_94080 [Streptomyces alanosinicus]
MRNRVAILVVAAVLPLTGAVSLATAGTAGANPNSKTVTVTGSVEDCESGGSPKQVTIGTSKESHTDDSPNVKNQSKYSVTFHNITKKGRDATVLVTCQDGDTYTDGFKIMRPAGTSTTMEQDISP